MTKHFTARVHSRFLFALAPIVESAREREIWSRPHIVGVIMEPCSTGGVLIIATDGHVIAALRDPKGYASEARHLGIPAALLDRARPVPPVTRFVEGEEYPLQAPEWMQPHNVYFSTAGAFILPAMPHPVEMFDGAGAVAHFMAEDRNVFRGEYRVFDNPVISWRNAFKIDAAKSMEMIRPLDPDVLSRLSGVCALLDDGSPTTRWLEFRGLRDPVLLRSDNPDVAAAVMPMRDGDPVPLPSWLGASAP